MEITLVDRTDGIDGSVREIVPLKLERLKRHDRHLERAEVRFSEERNPRIAEKERCDITMEGSGVVVRAHAYGLHPSAALDKVIDKLVHALERVDRSKDKAMKKVSA